MKEDGILRIVKKGYAITLITLISRPLGYVREAVQAYTFGATALVDSFILAFNLPELIQTLFFSGAASYFLVPISTRYSADQRTFSDVYSTFLNVTIIVTSLAGLILFFLSGFLLDLIAPGFSKEQKVLTINLFLIMLPVITLHGILSVMKSFLNAKDHYVGPEISGIVWNLAFILSCILLSKRLGIYSLALGVTFGSLLQVVTQYPFLKKHRIRYSLTILREHESLKEAKRLFLGALLSASILPINGFVDRVIGSFLPEGHVSSLSYAFRIFILPVSLFAVPIYTVSFTRISSLYHNGEMKTLFRELDNSMILLLITLVPSSLILCLLREEIVEVLYRRGAFGFLETQLTSRALLGYSLGIPFYAFSLLFVRTFNALHDTRTPAFSGLLSIFLNAILDILLMIPFKNLGISLATSLVSVFNFSILLFLLKKRTGYRLEERTKKIVVLCALTGSMVFLGVLWIKFLFFKSLTRIALTLILVGLVYLISFRKDLKGIVRKRY